MGYLDYVCEIDKGKYVDLYDVEEVLEQVQVCQVLQVVIGQVVVMEYDLCGQYEYLQQVGCYVQFVCVDQCEEC